MLASIDATFCDERNRDALANPQGHARHGKVIMSAAHAGRGNAKA
jgi:hypothetical protein